MRHCTTFHRRERGNERGDDLRPSGDVEGNGHGKGACPELLVRQGNGVRQVASKQPEVQQSQRMTFLTYSAAPQPAPQHANEGERKHAAHARMLVCLESSVFSQFARKWLTSCLPMSLNFSCLLWVVDCWTRPPHRSLRPVYVHVIYISSCISAHPLGTPAVRRWPQCVCVRGSPLNYYYYVAYRQRSARTSCWPPAHDGSCGRRHRPQGPGCDQVSVAHCLNIP